MSIRFGFAFLSLFTLFSIGTVGQTLPPKIRGYKVHQEQILVTNVSGNFTAKEKRKPSARVGEPQLIDVTLTGITLAASAQLNPVGQSGEIHFITFRDFKVNGIPVEIEEYSEPFTFGKDEIITLPKPAAIFIPPTQVLRAAWKEINDSKKEWTVSGQMFVFGKFRKLGFSFKRVIPVTVNMTIKNPLRDTEADLPS